MDQVEGLVGQVGGLVLQVQGLFGPSEASGPS